MFVKNVNKSIAYDLIHYGFVYITGIDHASSFLEYCRENNIEIEMIDCGITLTKKDGPEELYYVKTI